MKIKDIALSAAYVGQRVVKAIAVGAQEVWSAVKYIVFKDPVVEQICVSKFSSDGVGVTEEDAAKVTRIDGVFSGNADITSFDEFRYFVNVKVVSGFGGSSIKELIIPPNATEISRDAFVGCSKLTNLNFANIEGLKILGSTSLLGCPLRQEFTFSGLEYISDRVFLNSGIVSFVAPKLIGYAGEVVQGQTFDGCVSLQYVAVGLLERIKRYMFNNCSSLEEVVARSVNQIDEYAFNGCSKLSRVGVEWNIITSIGSGAFSGCSFTIEELDTPFLTSIGSGAFNGVTVKKVANLGTVASLPSGANTFGSALEEVILPDTCVRLGATGGLGPFEGNKNLTYVRLSPNTEFIGSSSFDNCTSLTTIDGLDNVQYIYNAFNGCPIDIEEMNYPNLLVCTGVFSAWKVKRVVSLGSITAFPSFADNTTLEEVNIHEGVTTIGGFLRCSKLGPVVTLPSTITAIGQNALNICDSLQKIICKAITPPELNQYSPIDTRVTGIYVPDESVEAYKTATNWINYANKIFPLSEYTES